MDSNIAKGKKIKQDQCRVCGDTAFYSYFGAISCQACKMFFKRHGTKSEKVLQCSYGGHCQINSMTRQSCSACRLNKCLSSGMLVVKIRRSSNVKLTENRLNKQSSISITSVLPVAGYQFQISKDFHEDQSCLVHNLTQSFDLSNINDIIEVLNIDQSQLTPLSSCSTLVTVIQKLLKTIYQTPVIIWRSNKDLQSFSSSSSDRSLFLTMAINNITCFLASYIFAQHNLYHNRYLVNHLSHLYGSNVVKCHQRTASFAQIDDPILFKLFLALFALSPVGRVNRSDLQQEFIHPKKIIDIEHRYAEVTWKYLLNKYKSSGEAVRRWMQMVRWLLSMSVLVYHSYDVETHMNDIENIVEEVQMNLIVDEMDELIDGAG